MWKHWRTGLVGVLVVAAAVAVAAPSSASSGGTDCSAQLTKAQQTLLGGQMLGATQLGTAQGCISAQSAARDDVAAAASVVVGSFQNSLLCLNFNSDGTISSTNPTWHVTSGGYLGVPGAFTIFSYSGSMYLGGFTSFGVTIGPFSIEFLSPFAGVITGSQVASCP